jgi:cell division protein FtsB
MVPKFDSDLARYFWYVILGASAVLLLFVGYKVGRWLGVGSQKKAMNQKEEELFSAQRGFKQVYDQELESLRSENAALKNDTDLLKQRVEEYRRKAAGYGGLFNSGGKQADAMYALLLENEALEEALFTQNDKLRQERTDAVKEQLRAASYRRVLMSQLMAEGKITDTARQVMGEDGPGHKQLEAAPAPNQTGDRPS